MSSPCNVPRLVRCRMRDLASCFYACRLPLEEETDNFCSKAPQMSNGGMVSNSKVAGRAHTNKNGGKSVQNLSRDTSKCDRVAENGNGSEPHFAEEDYIVFCFREDGKIDMINECNNKKSEDHEIDDQHKHIISATTLRPMINGKKVDEKRSKEKGNECVPADEIKEINSIEQQNNAIKMDSFESCDSNLSDTSTSSFAFPELGLDWIGSPVHMPKSEKPEAQSLRLHCCRF